MVVRIDIASKQSLRLNFIMMQTMCIHQLLPMELEFLGADLPRLLLPIYRELTKIHYPHGMESNMSVDLQTPMVSK